MTRAERRADSIRRAVARSRAQRIRAMEARLLTRLGRLKRSGPAEHAALVGMLRRVARIAGAPR